MKIKTLIFKKGIPLFASGRLKNKLNKPTNCGQLIDNQIEKETLLNTKELADKLSCSVSYIKKLKAEGKIKPYVSFSRFIRYKFSDVVASLQKYGVLT